MRILLSILAIFSLCGASAQPAETSYGRELPRGAVLVYPSQQEATAADGGDNRYFTRITEWLREENRFTTPFTVPFAWANRQVLLHVGSASADYEVLVNGKPVAYDSDGEHPAEFNITRHVREGRNTLDIVLRSPSPVAPLESWKQQPAPQIGSVWLMSQPTMRVRDVLVRTWFGDEERDFATAEVGVAVKSEALNPRTSRIHYELLTPTGERAASGYEELTLDMRREDTVRFLARIPANLLWSTELPTQYTLRLKTQHEGRFVEFLEMRLGFRTIGVRNGTLEVNGTPVALRAAEVPARVGEEGIARLREAGYNAICPEPGSVWPDLYDICDRLGIYAIVQAPVDTSRSGDSRRKGGNPSNVPEWTEFFTERIEDSYHTTKRHPSVIAFSLAKNSSNGICLYESYLKMKRFGDDRPFIYPAADGEWNSDRLTIE